MKLLVLYCAVILATVIRVFLFSWMFLFVPGSNCTVLGLWEFINQLLCGAKRWMLAG